MTSTRSARALVRSVRRWHRWSHRKGVFGAAARKAARLDHALWSAITGSDIVLGARLGENVMLPHPIGIVIHRAAIIGDDCMIMQHVTIGQTDEGSAPRVGNGVYVGAGAKILGDVTVGNSARIGANAVVLVDVPPDHTAVGIPARIIPPRESR